MTPSRLLRLFGYAWAAPCSLLGLAFGAGVLLAGGRACRREGVIEFALRRRGATSARRWPFAAIAFGHVVLARDEATLDLVRAHERVHVAQYERWGSVFLVAYPLASLLEWLDGRRPYLDNAFEVEARAGTAPAPERRA